MGCHNGIGARLQRNQPLLTSVHCMAHRLELAFKKVIQDNEAQLKVLEFLESIYKFYRNSSLNRSMLRQCSSAFGTTGIPTRLGVQNGYLIHTLPSSTSGKCITHCNSILERYVKYTHK